MLVACSFKQEFMAWNSTCDDNLAPAGVRLNPHLGVGHGGKRAVNGGGGGGHGEQRGDGERHPGGG